MPTTTRKKQERQQREQKILKVARKMFNQQGYLGLNMDRIAEQLQYSKGTIYNHFRCKEEIIIALAIETSNVLLELFQRAASTPGGSRERMTGIGLAFEIFVRFHPGHFTLITLLRGESLRQKTSAERQAVMRNCELRSTGIVAGIVRDGLASGDLPLPSSVAAEDVVFGLWSLTFGAYSLIATTPSLEELGVNAPFQVVRRQTETLLDGYPWHPMSSAFDYGQTREQMLKDCFAAEAERLDKRLNKSLDKRLDASATPPTS